MRLDTTRPPTALESRFGGPAMMPDGFEWPHYTAEPYMGRDPNDDPETYVVWYAKQQKLPMFLIAQLNLAELPIDSPLPRSGLLSLFTDPFDGVWGDSKSDLQGVRVIYTPQETFASLKPYQMPTRTDHHGAFAGSTWPECRIQYFLKWSFGDPDRLDQLLDGESDDEVAERMRATIQETCGYSFGLFLLDGGRNHQHDPRESALRMWDSQEEPPEDDDEPYEAYRARREEFARRAAAEWTCLFSITREGAVRPVVSDTGGLSFLIRKTDLAERRFDRVWIVRS
jgi:hypothetical protein